MNSISISILFLLLPLFAQAFDAPVAWAPRTKDYFVDVVYDFVSKDISVVKAEPSSLSADDLGKIKVYQKAVAANTAKTPVEVYDLELSQQGVEFDCLGLLVKRTSDIDRFKNKEMVERVRLVHIGHCKSDDQQQKVELDVAKYVNFPQLLSFGTSSGYERYRSIKNINIDNKILACKSTDTSPMTQGPLHAFAIYESGEDEYVVGWENATSSADPQNPEYPVRINEYHDLSSMKEIKDTIQFFQKHNGRGQIIFNKNSCQILSKGELVYLNCYTNDKDIFHPHLSGMSLEIVMKKTIDSRFLVQSNSAEENYYIATEVTIDFKDSTLTGDKRYSAGFEFRNNFQAGKEVSRECAFEMPKDK